MCSLLGPCIVAYHWSTVSVHLPQPVDDQAVDQWIEQLLVPVPARRAEKRGSGKWVPNGEEVQRWSRSHQSVGGLLIFWSKENMISLEFKSTNHFEKDMKKDNKVILLTGNRLFKCCQIFGTIIANTWFFGSSLYCTPTSPPTSFSHHSPRFCPGAVGPAWRNQPITLPNLLPGLSTTSCLRLLEQNHQGGGSCWHSHQLISSSHLSHSLAQMSVDIPTWGPYTLYSYRYGDILKTLLYKSLSLHVAHWTAPCSWTKL